MSKIKKSRFLAKHQQQVEKALYIVVSMLTVVVAFFMAAPIALGGGMLLCTLARDTPICSDKSLGVMAFGILALVLCLATATISLHKLAKIKWLISFELAVIGCAMLQILMAIPSTIMQADMPQGPWLIAFAALLAAILLIVIAFLLEVLGKWAHIMAVAILAAIILGGQLLNQPLKNAHQGYEVSKSYDEAQNMPFTIYSPSYIPSDYSLVDIVSIQAAGNLPQSFGLRFSNGSKENPYQSADEWIDIDEEARVGEANAPDKCQQVGMYQNAAPCQVLGKTKLGIVYNRFRSDDPSYYDVYTEINSTSIRLTARREIAAEDILRMLDSMQPRIDRP